MVLLVIFELSALDLVGEPFTVSALDQLGFVHWNVKLNIIKFRSIMLINKS